MRKIVVVEDPVLRTKTHDVPVADITKKEIKDVIKDMKAALSKEKFGVAIAAPQIGESLNIFVVAGKVFASRAHEDYDPKKHADHTFINPTILKASKKLKMGDEGCLSVPGKYGTKVERPEKVTISYHDEAGKKHERGASSFLARVFLHEIDHLNGVLYTDHALEVIDVDDELKPV